MNNFWFGLGCVFFVVFFGLLFYYMYTKDVEYYSNRSLICIMGMFLFEVLSFKFIDIFKVERVKLISICFASIMTIYIIMYIVDFAFDSMNNFELRHLILIIPIMTSLFTYVFLLKNDETIKKAESDYKYISVVIVSIVISFIGTAFFSRYHRKIQLLKSELRNAQRLLRYNHFETDFVKNNFSRSDLLKIEEAVVRLYLISQDKIPSTLKTLKALKKTKISSDLLHLIMERLYSEDLFKKSSFMTLTEFQQELLPELFTTKRVYRRSSMDMRYYEDFIEKIRFMLKSDNRTLDELNQKIDSLNQNIENNLLPNFKQDGLSETYGCQNQIRELFHALETPIATSEMAIANLAVSFGTLTDMQKDKFDKIQNNIKLIKSILFAYRELTFMNIYSYENTLFSLPEIIDSMKDILPCEEADSIVLEKQGIPDSIPQYSTNLIVVLIMPLIHNAIEASPCKKNVVINYTQTEIGYTIKIENFCERPPKQIDLDTDGYSSKGNNHVGTGISIVRRISKSVNVDFHLKVNKNKVVAQLVFPKQ